MNWEVIAALTGIAGLVVSILAWLFPEITKRRDNTPEGVGQEKKPAYIMGMSVIWWAVAILVVIPVTLLDMFVPAPNIVFRQILSAIAYIPWTLYTWWSVINRVYGFRKPS